jgi:hypothetical protein
MGRTAQAVNLRHRLVRDFVGSTCAASSILAFSGLTFGWASLLPSVKLAHWGGSIHNIPFGEIRRKAFQDGFAAKQTLAGIGGSLLLKSA